MTNEVRQMTNEEYKIWILHQRNKSILKRLKPSNMPLEKQIELLGKFLILNFEKEIVGSNEASGEGAVEMAVRLLTEKEEGLEDIYCELRGLLKKQAQFPDMWDTDKELSEWLKKRGELDELLPSKTHDK